MNRSGNSRIAHDTLCHWHNVCKVCQTQVKVLASAPLSLESLVGARRSRRQPLQLTSSFALALHSPVGEGPCPSPNSPQGTAGHRVSASEAQPAPLHPLGDLGCLDQALEERMAASRAALELGVALAGDVVGMHVSRQLDHLDEALVGRNAADDQARVD